MKNKNTVAIALVLVVAVIALAFGSQSSLTDKLFSLEQKAEAQSTSQLPTSVLYDHLFRLADSFRKKAEKQQSSGEEVTAYADYFKENAQLTDQENQILNQIASDFVIEAGQIDNQAEEIIEGLRKKNPNGYIEPPPELLSLQEQRNNTALSYRNQLSNSFGSVRFGEFDNFVHGTFASGIQAVSIPSE